MSGSVSVYANVHLDADAPMRSVRFPDSDTSRAFRVLHVGDLQILAGDDQKAVWRRLGLECLRLYADEQLAETEPKEPEFQMGGVDAQADGAAV